MTVLSPLSPQKTIMKYILTMLALLCGLVQMSAVAEEPFALPQPIPAHPRLFTRAADWERVKKQVVSDPVSARIFASLQTKAERYLPLPPAEYKLDGFDLLGHSRQVLERVTNLAAVARITGDARYVERAALEMRTVARFADWNPPHFLDTAEMALAVAIGYDWLYDQLSEADRAEFAQALVEKGLTPSLDGKQWWIAGTNNWNQVCHAGMVAAAIAVADLQPDLATQIVQRAIENVPHSAHAYDPDGVFPEGPNYWGYGTTFHILLVAELQTFSGQAYGMDTLPGFDKTAIYLNEVTAPSGRYFNYSDGGDGKRAPEAAIFWFAQRFHHPEWLRYELKELNDSLDRYDKRAEGERHLAFDLLWRNPSLADDGKTAFPLHWLGRGENPVVVHRAAWDDPDALYLALKGGSPTLSHAHMDVGSFILEADGVRWAVDPGMQVYSSLLSAGIDLWNYHQNSPRWDVFRLGPESHNILRFNGAAPLVTGSGAVAGFQGEGATPHSIFDLSSLYSDQVRTVHRGSAFLPGGRVLFQDEWTAKDQPVEAAWQMLTRADVTVQPGEIQLSEKGKTLTLKVLAPADAHVEVQEVQQFQKWFDVNNPGVRRIVITTHTAAGADGSLKLVAIPGSAPKEPAKADILDKKLHDWSPSGFSL